MILVKSKGELGNQMFQYAFGFAAARRLQTTFCVNKLRDLTYFDLDGVSPAVNFLRRTRFQMENLGRSRLEKNYLAFNDTAYTAPETVLAELADDAIYRGYFQSWAYYVGFENEVKNLFRVKELHCRQFEQRCKSLIDGPPLGILHLRGKWHGDWERIRLPWTYYENCLRRVKDREKYRWVILTDDISNARKRLPDGFPMELICGHAIDDFQLMMRAGVLIMANSTFSWWAGYLNPDPKARIMAPNYWYGHLPEYQWEAPAGIMYPNWEWVPSGEDAGGN